MDILTEKQYEPSYQLYRGFDASPSKLIYRPDILFLAYNPSGGVDYWRLNHHPHLFLWPHLNERELMFFGKNAARKGGEWYELDKEENNSFPRQIVDLLYVLASMKYPGKDNERGTNKKPFWADDFKNSMVYLNLYPIATEDGDKLVRLFRKLHKDKDLSMNFKNEWQLRMYFINIMHKMVSLISPKVIVCMGAQTFHDYTYSERCNHTINEIMTDAKYDNLIGFSRRGAWDGNIDNIAKAIADRI